MNEIINETVIPLINDGMLNIQRINALIDIKEFIDNISTRPYIRQTTVEEILEKYSVMPSIITWGDYFQSELATVLVNNSDDEFFRAVETVKYDMISSFLIFSDKDNRFFDWVEDNYLELIVQEKDEYSEEENEIIHLKILKDYFVDLEIVDSFSETVMKWYHSFKDSIAM